MPGLIGSFSPSMGCGRGHFSLSRLGQPHPEASARGSQPGPSRPLYSCSVLGAGWGGVGVGWGGRGRGAQTLRQLRRFTSTSEPANIFSLSTPQFLKFKPHHMLWPGGLGGGGSSPVGRLLSYNKFRSASSALPVGTSQRPVLLLSAGERGAGRGAELVAKAPALAPRPWNDP